jgi:hypothetical protein
MLFFGQKYCRSSSYEIYKYPFVTLIKLKVTSFGVFVILPNPIPTAVDIYRCKSYGYFPLKKSSLSTILSLRFIIQFSCAGKEVSVTRDYFETCQAHRYNDT